MSSRCQKNPPVEIGEKYRHTPLRAMVGKFDVTMAHIIDTVYKSPVSPCQVSGCVRRSIDRLSFDQQL